MVKINLSTLTRNVSRLLAYDPAATVTAAAPLVLPATANHATASAAVLRTARLQAVANYLASVDKEQLAGLAVSLEALIVESNPTGAGSRKQQQSRLVKLTALTDAAIQKSVKSMTADALARFDQVAHKLGCSDASTVPVLGSTLKEHYDKLANDLSFKVRAAIRQGVAQGETAQDIAARLTGSASSSPVKAAEPSPAQVIAIDKRLTVGVKIFDGTETTLDRIIKAAVTALASAADEEDADDDTEKNLGWQWLAVMDAATCPACEFYDGNQWTKDFEPVGDAPEYPGDPGLHPNCRCSRIPVDLDAEPAGQALNAAGKKIDISMKDYLAQFNEKELNEAFGPQVLKSWRRGDITDAQLTSQKDHMLTLEKFLEGEK